MRSITWIGIAAAVAVLLGAADAHADIAPTPRPGYSLAPDSETRVRMARERVDITIGERPNRQAYTHLADIAAAFEMVNDTPDTVTLDVGFPVEAEFLDRLPDPSEPPFTLEDMAREAQERLEEYGWYRFHVSIDGGDIFAPDPVKSKGLLHGRWGDPDYLWFHWTMTFAPGTTRVDVSYRVPSLYSRGTGYQNIGYVLQSGALWAGPIDTAVVAVHFPESAPPVHPSSRTTTGFQSSEHTVTWTYFDIEPGPENDINIEFISPDVARAMQDLCDRLVEVPDDVDAMIELARLEADVLPHGADTPDHPDFAATPDALLGRALEREPHNGTAWYTYLCWYLGVRDSRLGFDFYRTEGGESRDRLLERAHAACPDDPGVTVLYESLHPHERKLPESLWRRTWHGQGAFQIPIDGFGATGVEGSDVNINLIEACYARTAGTDSLRTDYTLRGGFSDEQRRAVLDWLSTSNYFKVLGEYRIGRYDREFQKSHSMAVKRPL